LAKAIGVLKQTNPEILAVLQSESEVLERVQNSFHTMIRLRNQEAVLPIEITCFYEELPLRGVGIVVPSHSAILPGYIPIGIRSNHMDMTKFKDAEDPGFVAVAGELRRWVKDIARSNGRQSSLGGEDSQQSSGDEEPQDSAGHRVLRITQGGSRFGPTTVTGGSVFQGNFVGRNPPF